MKCNFVIFLLFHILGKEIVFCSFSQTEDQKIGPPNIKPKFKDYTAIIIYTYKLKYHATLQSACNLKTSNEFRYLSNYFNYGSNQFNTELPILRLTLQNFWKAKGSILKDSCYRDLDSKDGLLGCSAESKCECKVDSHHNFKQEGGKCVNQMCSSCMPEAIFNDGKCAGGGQCINYQEQDFFRCLEAGHKIKKGESYGYKCDRDNNNPGANNGPGGKGKVNLTDPKDPNACDVCPPGWKLCGAGGGNYIFPKISVLAFLILSIIFISKVIL